MSIKYPYTDFHEMNLDWTMQTAKKAGEDSAEALETANDASEKVDDFIENLDLQEEVDTKINEMTADGSLNDILDPVTEQTVSDWLAQHIGPTTPAVDNTLTIAGAAADSKTVGDILETALITRYTLTGNDDMNAVTQTGIYYVQANDYPDNIPVNAAGRLMVVKAASAASYAIAAQIYFSGNELYYRVSKNNANMSIAWSGVSWNTAANLDDLQTVFQYRGGLTSADDLNSITDAGLYSVSPDNGFPANLPIQPKAGKVLVLKGLNDYVAGQIYFYRTIAGDCRFMFRSSKSTLDPATQWTDVNWVSMITDENLNGIIHYNSRSVKIPLTNASMQPNGRYSGVVTNRLRPINSQHDLINFTLPGHDIRFWYYSSPYDFDEATYLTPPTNFLYSTDWFNMDTPVTPEPGKHFVFMVRKSDNTNMTPQEMEYVRENLYCETYDLYDPMPVYFQVETLPPTAVDYHAKWDDLLSGSEVTRTLLGKVNNSDNYPIYAYEIHTQRNSMTANYGNVTYDGTNAVYPRKKVFIMAGQHGNEKCTPMDVYALAKELINGSMQDVGAMFDWYIIPLANPWGYSHVNLDSNGKIIYRYGTVAQTIDASWSKNAGIRTGYGGYDVNRDWSDTTYAGSDGLTYGFQSQETQIMKTYALANNWDIFIDVHQNNQDKYDAMPRTNQFTGVAYNNSTDASWLHELYLTIDNANRNTVQALERYFRRAAVNHQASVIWKRYSCDDANASRGTACNYVGGYTTPGGYGNSAHTSIAAACSFTIETSELAWTYSQLSDQTNTPASSWYNPIACTCSTTGLANLVKSIANTYAFMI